jgi:hypothetical protein
MIYLFDYKKIMQPNTVVHCDTEEKAKKLLEWADSRGLKWCSGDRYIDYGAWALRKEKTCFYLKEGKYGGLEFCKDNNYTILTYEEALLNDFDLIYKIETGDFGNRCETVYCVDYKKEVKTYNKYIFDIEKTWSTYIGMQGVIFIGSKEGKSIKKLNKTEILNAFCELGVDRNWKVKVIYDNEEYIYDWKTIPQAVKEDGSPVYMYSKSVVSDSIDNDYRIIKGEDVKMAGKKADVKVTVAFLDNKTGELEIQHRYHTEIHLVSKDKRNCAVEGGSYDDVVCLEVDGVEEIPYLTPEVIKTDDREEKLKLIVEQCKLNNKILLGLIDKTPEIEGKLVELQRKISNMSSYVSYELNWNVAK